MNEFQEVSTGLIVDEKTIRIKFQNISFPAVLNKDILKSIGYVPILDVPMPVTAYNQIAVKTGVEKDKLGNTVYKWVIHDLPTDVVEQKKKDIKLSKWRDIQSIRDSKMAGGVMVAEKWFHTDTNSLVQYLAMLAAGESLPSNINWKTMDGSFITMTPALAKEIYAATMTATNNIFNTSETLRVLMEESENPFDFDIELNAGWPESYLETL